MSVRLKDVAVRAGVSIRTVSNVVNDYPYVRAETRARVQAAIDELGYRPNLTARQLRRGRTGMIALAVPDLTIPYFGELAGHVLMAAERHGLTLLIEQTAGSREREVMLAQGPRAKSIDGLLLSPLAADVEDLPTGSESVPLVLLGERIYDPRFDHVAIDNVAAAEAATRHLLESGRRRVAAVGVASSARSTMADLRLRGYRQAMDGYGLTVDERLVVRTTWFRRPDGYVATKQLLESGEPPEAMFCFNDLIAHGALRALSEAGLRCPEDVAVIGIDDIEENRYTVPSLTSIAPDKSKIAHHAVELLVRRIGGERPDGVDYTPGFSLSVRESAP
ncbi:substrate-binding domain-containing protein [Nocardioides panaciterrulae]|uniref:DNA-binding LacI/PurR family transcriptional regulator n=1 Tax=Nocardioides panaciterrulae TaxID=661492 RepID=A0A7Y9E8Z5_9ACTN|nr:DNA-binding LacI/PurR family transcriptional regulator [Nocardioides panaciterrulae]